MTSHYAGCTMKTYQINPCTSKICAMKYQEVLNGNIVCAYVRSQPVTMYFLHKMGHKAIIGPNMRLSPFPTYFISDEDKESHYNRDASQLIIPIDNTVVRYVRKLFNRAKISKIITMIIDKELKVDEDILHELNIMKINSDTYYLLRFLILSHSTTIIHETKKILNVLISLYYVKHTRMIEEKIMKKSKVTFLYHGSPFGNWHSILHWGLRDCSGTNMMIHGSVHGNGIYLTTHFRSAVRYCDGKRLDSSKVDRIVAVVVVEGDLSRWDRGHGIFVVKDESIITIRYLVCIPDTLSTSRVVKLGKYLTCILKGHASQHRISIKATRAEREKRLIHEFEGLNKLHQNLGITAEKITVLFTKDTITIDVPFTSVPKATLNDDAENISDIVNKILDGSLMISISLMIPRQYPCISPIIFVNSPILDHGGISPHTGLVYNYTLFDDQWNDKIKLIDLFMKIYNDIILQARIILIDSYTKGNAQKEHDDLEAQKKYTYTY